DYGTVENTYTGTETNEHYAIMGQMSPGEFGSTADKCRILANKGGNLFWDKLTGFNIGLLLPERVKYYLGSGTWTI
ncbi:MAG: hypothetical protein RSD78_08525, partial [Oscillospiraceae bacterium]